MNIQGRIRRTISSICIVISLCFSSLVYAAAPISPAATLPGSALPERAGSTFAPPASTTPQALPARKAHTEAPEENPLGSEAGKIQFKLVRIVLQGNHVYSTEELSRLYQDKINKLITVAELQDIVQSITNYYRNNGYILSRAVLPPQHVANGIVYIQILEGYIDKVIVVGVPKGTRAVLQKYGDNIALQRPLHIKTMEHYLLVANEIPGLQVKAVLEPSKTKTGASDLNLVAVVKTVSAYASYDNYGTLYIGPLQRTLGGEADSIFLSGDSIQISNVTTTQPQQLRFLQLGYTIPVGREGGRVGVSGNQALTRPGLILQPLKIDGISNTFSATAQYPMIRSRETNMTLDGAFNYIDSTVTTLQISVPLYTDHLRTLSFGGTFNKSDSWQGANQITAHVEHGLPGLGSTPVSMSTSGLVSRYGGSGHFTRISGQVSRLQSFGSTRWSAFINTAGQYAFEPLLASEQFSFGGAPQAMGRGYDPAEIIGDRGLAGSVELRISFGPDKPFLKTIQFYTFFDAGVIWNMKTVPDQKRKQSATSTGLGTRFSFNKYVIGNLMIAQPLTRQVSTLAVLGNGRKPRVFFSFTASI